MDLMNSDFDTSRDLTTWLSVAWERRHPTQDKRESMNRITYVEQAGSTNIPDVFKGLVTSNSHGSFFGAVWILIERNVGVGILAVLPNLH